MQSTYSLLIAP